jgi:hypothetical protein
MMNGLGTDKTDLFKIYFSDKVTSHLRSIMDRHNFQHWGNKNPHTTKRIRDSFTVKVFCAITSDTQYGPLFFAENTAELSTWICLRFVSRPTCYEKYGMLFSNTIAGSVDGATCPAREKCFLFNETVKCYD